MARNESAGSRRQRETELREIEQSEIGHPWISRPIFRDESQDSAHQVRRVREAPSRMMRADLQELYASLERSPEDWSVRLRLIDAATTAGDLAEARRLVRTSPERDDHLPAELQDRIHRLLTGAPRGKSPVVVEIEVEGSGE